MRPADLFTKLVLLPAIVCVTLPLALITVVQGDVGRVILDRFLAARYGSGPFRPGKPGMGIVSRLAWYGVLARWRSGRQRPGVTFRA